MQTALERFFRLHERGTTVRTEVLGGVTTFAAMAYIIVVNPAILSFAGLPVGPSTVATILVAVVGTLLMGLYANRPLAVAPYMGENAFIAFGLPAMGVGWQLRLGAVFVAGLVFLVLSIVGIRAWLGNAVSPSLKHSFGAGIGLFLAFLGLNQTGIVVSGNPAVPVRLGDLHDTKVLLAVGGFLLTAILLCRRMTGAILIGMAATALAGYALGVGARPTAVLAAPFTGEYDLGPIAFQLDVSGALRLSFLPVLLTLVLMSFLDTLGTLVGVGAAGGMLDEKGNFPDIEKPMLVDAATCVLRRRGRHVDERRVHRVGGRGAQRRADRTRGGDDRAPLRRGNVLHSARAALTGNAVKDFMRQGSGFFRGAFAVLLLSAHGVWDRPAASCRG